MLVKISDKKGNLLYSSVLHIIYYTNLLHNRRKVRCVCVVFFLINEDDDGDDLTAMIVWPTALTPTPVPVIASTSKTSKTSGEENDFQ